ncbi:hypothetical protein [Sphingobacterium sp. ML3W]|uniref:hypothetical protein n=1 Tax=Sphingobacterium sp. ML3W TaxID=1538644 RepID=UPI000570F66C|nr:hypothetical protein [Sphingobacterium sp. ML3W]
MQKSEKLKSIRILIAMCVGSLAVLPGSREMALAKTKLEEGSMEIGLALKFLGETPYPYALGADKTTTYIDPSADTSDKVFADMQEGQHIFNIKLLREKIGLVENGLNPSLYGTLNPHVFLWMQEALKSATMARCWLGKELGRLRDAELEVAVTGVSVGENIKVEANPETSFLSWDQAENLLNIGQCVKVPEWKGFWFKSLTKDHIFVLTQDGDILDTPNDSYKDRQDWIVAIPTEEQHVLLGEFFEKHQSNSELIELVKNSSGSGVLFVDDSTNQDNVGKLEDNSEISSVEVEVPLKDSVVDINKASEVKADVLDDIKTTKTSNKKSSKS